LVLGTELQTKGLLEGLKAITGSPSPCPCPCPCLPACLPACLHCLHCLVARCSSLTSHHQQVTSN
jgi:hypothetical protein